MRVVGPDEREPEGSVSLAVIVEDLTVVRDQVIECQAQALDIPDGDNLRTQLDQLRMHVEIIIGSAQAQRGQ